MIVPRRKGVAALILEPSFPLLLGGGWSCAPHLIGDLWRIRCAENVIRQLFPRTRAHAETMRSSA